MKHGQIGSPRPSVRGKGPWVRGILRGLALGGMLVACAHTPPSADAPDRTLQSVYKDAFLIGTAVNAAIVAGDDPGTAALVERHFSSITAENVLKNEIVHPRPGVYDFAPGDAFVAYGERHGMFIVGHTLVWHNQTPDWFFLDDRGQPNPPDAQLARMCEHIAAVAGRYAGRIHAWDVVNEVIDDDGQYRPTRWVQAVGDGDRLVREAFRCAQEHAPGTELYYNDFNTFRPAKRAGIVRMVRMLQAHGIRIDGVGMQGHWGLHYPDLQEIEDSIDAYAALGVKVMVTELDIDVLPLTREGQVIGTGMQHPQFQLPEFERYLDPYQDGLPPAVGRQLAERYATLFRLFLRKREAIARVTFWGVHDGMSWKNDYPVPHRTNYPLLFDRQRQPKAAFQAVQQVPAE